MFFLVWKLWSNDLFTTIPYESYCRPLPQLHPLLTSVYISAIEIKRIKNTAISLVVPGDVVYVDIRSHGYDWFASLNLPNSDYTSYVVLLKYTSWFNSKCLEINGTVAAFNENWCSSQSLSATFVYYWGHTKKFDSSNMILIDKIFIQQHPQITSTSWILCSLPRLCLVVLDLMPLSMWIPYVSAMQCMVSVLYATENFKCHMTSNCNTYLL